MVAVSKQGVSYKNLLWGSCFWLDSLFPTLGQYVTIEQPPLSHTCLVLSLSWQASPSYHVISKNPAIKNLVTRVFDGHQSWPSLYSSILASCFSSCRRPFQPWFRFLQYVWRQDDKTGSWKVAQTTSNAPPLNKLGGIGNARVSHVYAFYHIACNTLSKLRKDILNGLCL